MKSAPGTVIIFSLLEHINRTSC